MTHNPTVDILQQLREGRMVILADDEGRENEGDLLLAAEHVTPEAINFMAQHGRGLICLTLTEEHCRALGLSLMVQNGDSRYGTAFTISIEAAHGVSTGISAQDRAHTIATAVRLDARPSDLIQPGHVFPLMSRKGGVLVRAGHTEAGCDLAQLAGLRPAAVICEILKSDGTMARWPDLLEFSKAHQLHIGTITDLIEYRMASEQLVAAITSRKVTTPYGPMTVHAFRDNTNQEVHLAMVMGEVRQDRETLVRVQEGSADLNILSLWHPQKRLDPRDSLEVMAKAGGGVLVLLHRTSCPDELLHLLREDEDHGSRWDPRLYGIGAQILRQLGVHKMKLLSSPVKMPSLAGFGLEVSGFISS